MDLSQLSTQDLLALKGGDLSQVSTEGLQALKKQQAVAAAQAEQAKFMAGNDPTIGMSGMDKFNAGVGKAFHDIYLGAKQRLGLASRDDVTETRRLEAPLMNTGAAKAGNLMGNVAMLAPTAMIPGANTVTGAATLGATVGLMQPSASLKEDALNVGLGAAAGAGGQYIANLAGNAATTQAANNAATTAQNAQKTQAAQRASQAGYVIPPEDLSNPNLATRVLQGVGGKIKTAQVASERNQEVTNRLARQALGMAPDAPLDRNVLNGVRQQAAQAYDQLRNVGQFTADQQFRTDLQNIAAPYNQLATTYPGLAGGGHMGGPTPLSVVQALDVPTHDAGGLIEAMRRLRFDGFANRSNADPERRALGQAQVQAAEALENLVERNLQNGGQTGLLDAFRNARQQIAQTFSVERALNQTTGDVSANALASQLKRGTPLTGDLRAVAEANQAFPKATQALKEAPKSLSPLDMALAVIQRDPMALLTLGARPAARSIMLSQPMQQNALRAAATPQPANTLLRGLAQEQLTLPASFAGSNALAAYLAQQQ